MNPGSRIASCLAALIAVTVLVSACSKAPESAPPTAAATQPKLAAAQVDDGIAWQTADVDAVFAKASADGKPVFLYWGAKWCPPCNQVKATIFNRQDFIERSRHFVPVYVDGDGPNAQRLGSRFKVSGYPTMILFTPDGKEITRLPGEVDAEQYMQVLNMGMNGARPIKETLTAALATGRRGQAASRRTTGACCRSTRGTPTTRSWSRKTTSRHACETGAGVSRRPGRLRDAAGTEGAGCCRRRRRMRNRATTRPGVALLRRALTEPETSRANFDILTNYASDLASYVTLPKSPERAQLLADWDAALSRWIALPNLSTADRLTAVTAQVQLARARASARTRCPRRCWRACASRSRAPIAKRRSRTRGRR